MGKTGEGKKYGREILTGEGKTMELEKSLIELYLG